MSELTRRQFIGTAAGLFDPSLVFTVPATDLEVNPRTAWATDRPAKGPLPEEDVELLVVHHSASHNDHTPGDAPAILRSFYDFHTGPEKGWNDIAYNFLVDSGGGVWEGRTGSLDGPVAGDATGGNQGFSQLVCLIGDFNTAVPTRAALSSLVTLLAWLADRYGLDTTDAFRVTFISKGSNLWPSGVSVTTPTIVGHSSMSRTTCPGSNLNSYVVGGLMADVTRARREGPGTITQQGSLPAQESSTPIALAQEMPSPATDNPVTSDLVPPPTSTTTTTLPRTPSPTRSPLVLTAAVIAALATLLAAWRARRMKDN
jgi:hypothetical protein